VQYVRHIYDVRTIEKKTFMRRNSKLYYSRSSTMHDLFHYFCSFITICVNMYTSFHAGLSVAVLCALYSRLIPETPNLGLNSNHYSCSNPNPILSPNKIVATVTVPVCSSVWNTEVDGWRNKLDVRVGGYLGE